MNFYNMIYLSWIYEWSQSTNPHKYLVDYKNSVNYNFKYSINKILFEDFVNL